MKCRHCHSEVTLNFLDLGSAPFSNAFLGEEDLAKAEAWFPLHLLVCENCWLVQTEDFAKHDTLFAPDYAYFSSFSTSWLAHAQSYAENMVRRFGLSERSLVCEIAANDGYLLQYFKALGIPCYGVEPTHGTAAAARARGIEIVESFFGTELAESLAGSGRQADLIAANNVLAHVPDINDFAAAFTRLLKPDGVATFEFPHLLQMEQQSQFDTAYHEHFSYLSLSAVSAVFKHAGLAVFDVETLLTHGGSLRVYAQRADRGGRAVGTAVSAMVEDERRAGLFDAAFYRGFQTRAEAIKDNVLAFLIDLKRDGRKIGGYGAAAKGNTLLNFAGIRRDLLPYVVDRNPAKQGRFTPGGRIPIVSEDRLKADRPDYIFILPWNLHKEVEAQLDYARAWGAKFVTAVPRITIYE